MSILDLSVQFLTTSGLIMILLSSTAVAGTGIRADVGRRTAVWTTNEDVVAGGVDTDDAATATQAASVLTGNSSAAGSGALTIASGTSATGSGAVAIATGNTSAGASGGITIASGTASTTRGLVAVTGIRTVAGNTAAAIVGATTLTQADSGGVFSVSQAAAYDIDLPSPTSGPGLRYQFYLTAPGANNVTVTVLGGAATFVGTIINDVTSVLPATGATLTFVSGTSVLGDNIEIVSISTALYLVRAISSAAGGITIA